MKSRLLNVLSASILNVLSKSFKVGENIVRVSNSLDLAEMSKLFAYGTLVVIGGLRVNMGLLYQ